MQLQLHLHSRLNTWLQWIGQRQLEDEMRNIEVLEVGVTYIRGLTVYAICPAGFFLLPSWYLVSP